METTKCRRLPVMNDQDHVIGMVTMRNILELLIKEIEQEKGELQRYIQT